MTDEWMKNYLRKKWNLPDNVEMDLSGLKITIIEKKEDTSIDTSKLTYNDTITYTCAFSTEHGREDQDPEHGPYSSLVVDIGEKLVEVRADGMHALPSSRCRNISTSRNW